MPNFLVYQYAMVILIIGGIWSLVRGIVDWKRGYINRSLADDHWKSWVNLQIFGGLAYFLIGLLVLLILVGIIPPP